MRIKIRDSGRVLEGTVVEIVTLMKADQFGAEDLQLGEFVDEYCGRLKTFKGIDLDIIGEDGAEKAENLIDMMVEAGLAEYVDAGSEREADI